MMMVIVEKSSMLEVAVETVGDTIAQYRGSTYRTDTHKRDLINTD